MNYETTKKIYEMLESRACKADVLAALPIEAQGLDYDEDHSDIFFCSLIPIMEWLSEDQLTAISNKMFSYQLFDALWHDIQHKMNIQENLL